VPSMKRGNIAAPTKTARVSKASIVVALIALTAAGCQRASGGADVAPSPASTLPVSTGDYPAYGHAPDFSWIAGKLVRSSPAGQCTFLMFATRRGQPWGGRIALSAASGAAERFPTGDMVVVTGSLDTRVPSACGQPALTVKTIEEH